MSKTLYKEGTVIDFTNTGSAINAGDVVDIGNGVGIALTDIAATTGVGPVAIAGVHTVTKAAGVAWTLGMDIFYAGSNQFNTVATGNQFAGVAFEAATSGATSGKVLLQGRQSKFTSPGIVTSLNDINGNELVKVTATTSAVNEVTLANAATGNDPSVTASGGDTDVGLKVISKGAGSLTLQGPVVVSNVAGTGAGAIGAVSGQDITITAGNDLTLRSGPLAADKVNIAAYDVDATAYVNVIQAAAHASDPTLTLTASGGITANGSITVSNAAGTGAGAIAGVSGQDVTVTAGNDLALKAGPLAADLLNLQVYDVDATAYVSIVSAAGHATVPTLALCPAGTALGVFGASPATQQAHITVSTTDTSATNISPAINSIIEVLETYGFIATA